MNRSSGGGNIRRNFWGLLFCAVTIFILTSSLPGEERKEAGLSFAMPADRVLKYKISSQIEQNFFGIDMSINQSLEVEVSLDKKTEEGNYKILLAFKKTKASRIMDDEIMDWEPPLKLEGKTIYAIVSPAGEVVEVDPGGFIPGMKKIADLKRVVDPWFIDLPDTLVKVGVSWTKEIIEKGDGGEGEEPGVKGEIVYTFKKIDKKKGIEVAVIEAKIKVNIHNVTPAGVMDAEGKGKGKAYVAIEGGYVVEGKTTVDIKGKMVKRDPLTGGEKETDMAMSQYLEIKLKK
ncbi:MAG: hypothetical protein KAX38_00050 [Candidatus Krumholzibacteria bacterium]|nr:hypothetical protein [Candidatus Krumholzibacteria bacterium]